jgi:rusticyanin
MSGQQPAPGIRPGALTDIAPPVRVAPRLSTRQLALSLAGTTLLVAVVLVGAGYAFGRISAPTPALSQPSAMPGMPPAATASSPAAPAGTPGPSSPPDPSSSSLADSIGQAAGRRLAGNAPQTVTAAQVVSLGNQVPAGASIDRAADRITFTGSSASLVIEASPANGPDMTFRIAGLVNPTLVMRSGTQVTVQFINPDPDQAHAWEITTEGPPFSFLPGRQPAIDGAQATVIGDPTGAGAGSRTITFTATTVGTFHYICPMPGHAQMGMNGVVIVT